MPDRRTAAGELLFARYAYPPNLLGYCGPDDPGALFDVAAGKGEDAGVLRMASSLRSRARAFDGAWVYLKVIAEAAGIADPLDHRVVEAYWLGNELLEQVDPAEFASTIRASFSGEVGAHWAGLDPSGRQPSVAHHGFQVFTVYPWVPLLGRAGPALTVLDRCRIRWAQVTSIDQDYLEVRCQALSWTGGELSLAPAQVESVRWARDGRSLLDRPDVGDWVSLHWDWACDRLSAAQLDQLRMRTDQQLATTNRALAQETSAPR